jgi:hypothetical protein
MIDGWRDCVRRWHIERVGLDAGLEIVSAQAKLLARLADPQIRHAAAGRSRRISRQIATRQG